MSVSGKGFRSAARVALLLAFVETVFTSGASAQAVPSPWVAADIGTPALAGLTTYTSGVFTVVAAGTDVWGTSDQFRFVYQQVTGDVDVVARVDSILKIDSWSKAGVM